MKKRLLIGIISSFLLIVATFQSKAQLSIHLNIGTQPVWGPVGYDQADYYYMPDIESYYSVSTHQFIYLNGGRWIYSTSLPPRYAHYDLYSGYKVVVNRPRPYLNFNQDRVQYARYRGYRGHQDMIRDSHDARYNHGGNPHGRNDHPDNHGHDNHHDDHHGNNGHGHEDHHDNGHGHDDHHDNHGHDDHHDDHGHH